ncbi:MAG: restriction endonuclease [Rhodoblastus sp.]|nr:MAG: restriction endonuclease [Rhodoblastus sp.]
MDLRRIWAVRAGRDNQADHLFFNRGQISLGLGAGGDARLLRPTRAAFKEAFAGAGAAAPGSIPIQAGQLFRFVHEMKLGDSVVYPRKIDRTLRWGEVTGDYVYDGADGSDFPHRRSVRWLSSRSRDDFSPGALYELGSVLTLFEVKSFATELRRRFEAGEAPEETEEESPAVARDIAETTRDFISKTIKTDFKGYPFEQLVAELFRAMGYRVQVTQKSKDDGVDVVACRDPLGVEPPILKIQAKAQDSNAGADVVKAFYASIHERDVGVFVTTAGFTAAAQEFARMRGNLRLIDGVELVDLIQDHYESFDQKMKRRIPLRRVLAPDVAPEE